jgi:hypothetical protein
MPEILTESFCERCGTRYTFESARPKVRLKGVKVLSRGLKNFVLSDDTTMDEAMAAARSETDREVTAHQLDAFHKTFNFCMSCRQYTCPNCWNDVEARCLSCAPLALPEIAPSAFPSVMTLAQTMVVAEPATNGLNGHDRDATELAPDRDAEPPAAGFEAMTSEPEAPAAGVEAPAALAAEAVAEPEAIAEVVAEPAAKATSQTAGLLRRFRPGQSLDDELAAFELERSDDGAAVVERQADQAEAPAQFEASLDAVATEPMGTSAAEQVEALVEPLGAFAEEPAEAAVAEPLGAFAEEPAEAVADEPVEAVADEPVEAVADLEPEPVSTAEAAPELAQPSPADHVEQPTWRITAPDVAAPGTGVPTQGDQTVPLQAIGSSVPSVEPQWPAKPEWPARQASMGLPFLGRPAQPGGGIESLWAASNRELVATPPVPGRSTSGIQPCISCGLSLSANARFCRRCGTLQAG